MALQQDPEEKPSLSPSPFSSSGHQEYSEKNSEFSPSFGFVFSYIGHHLKPHKFSFFILMFNSVCGALLTVTGPFLVKKFIDHLTFPLGPSFYFWLSLYFIEIVCIVAIYRLGDYFVNIRMTPAMRRSITQGAMEELMKKNLHYYHEQASGDLASRVKELVKNVPDFLRTLAERLMEPFLSLLLSIGFLYALNPFFGWALSLWLLSCAGVFALCNPIISKYGAQMADFGSKITGYNVDVLSNIIPLRLFGCPREERRLALPLQEKAQKAEEKMEWGYFALWTFYGISIFVFEVFAIYFMVIFRQRNSLTLGDCLFILTLHGRIFSFLWQVALDASNGAKLYAGISQALSIIYKPMNYEGSFTGKPLQISSGSIVVEDLEFSYNTQDKTYTFSCPSLIIPGGQKVGIVGQSGAGKTTFINLLMGFYTPQKGRILLDGQDISTVSKETLWKVFGVVSQEGGLFNRSVKDNIAYGRPEAALDEIQGAAKMAFIHEAIMNFPEQYHTSVGERGSKLSGGQRQRLHLARCILKGASVLILDEATSALDSKTEQEIFQQIQQIMGDKTTLMIAHRLSTLKAVERILVFHRGILVQDGSHENLLKEGRFYGDLWQNQQNRFQENETSHVFF